MRAGGTTNRRLVPLLAPPVVLALMLAASHLDLVQHLENVTVDWRFRAREKSDPPADPRILLVGIGEYSLDKFGRWEEWTRQIHGQFLEKLSLRPPAVVAYDFFYSEPSKNPENDQIFGDWLAAFPGAITGAVADDAKPEAAPYAEDSIGKTEPISLVKGDTGSLFRAPTGPVPIPDIAQSAWTGFVNSPPSRIDGMRRVLPVVVEFGGKIYPSFVLQILMRIDGARAKDVEVVVGEAVIVRGPDRPERRIPIDERGLMTLNYRGGATFEPIDYAGLYEMLKSFETTNRWPASQPPVTDQIVIIGQMAEGLTDFGPTPLKPREPLVIVQAVALNNILQQDFLKVSPDRPVLLAWLVLAWLTAWFLRRTSVVLSVAIPLALVAAYGIIVFHLFRTQSLQLPLFLPVVGFLFGVNGSTLVDRLVAEIRAKGRIKNLFGTYVSPEVVDRMVASGEDPKLGGQISEITAFFSDVQGFSTFSEQLDAERLVTLMIDYLSEMTDILQYRGGSLDKYIGDAIVGMFGAPLPLPDHAYQSCCAAIEIQRRQGELREKWRAEGTWPEIVHQMQTRIGLNTGNAVIGNMGSRRRFNYTMMGDNVNLAARCESGAKSYGVYTMVTGETRRASLRTKSDIAFRYLDKIVVKGRTQPVEMYEVIDFVSSLTPEVTGCIETYEEGIRRYLARDWDGAKHQFEASAKLESYQPGKRPGVYTNPSLVMIERCLELKADPPPDDWDGVHVMESK
ncbi:MAG: adenylate/guanylate cyclase domain-containing protein [Verrucomicrobiae bacterium]|nr:adenylate/guanylate cyclase domain-containing protein [Verrucomicrobiae bacterium]